MKIFIALLITLSIIIATFLILSNYFFDTFIMDKFFNKIPQKTQYTILIIFILITIFSLLYDIFS